MLQRPPSAHAARQRRYRRRQRNGEIMVTIGLSPAEVDTLHRLRCLDLDKLEDRAAIADAVHLLLANILDA
jgi:hypothetical protein